MSPWLKAGLIGGAILVVLNLLGVIPCVGVFTCILGLVAYAGIGALAAHWMPPQRESGSSAAQGALAAVVAALFGGLVNMVVLAVQAAVMGSAGMMSQLPPDALRQLEQAGMDPQMFEGLVGPVGVLFGGGMCCLGGLVLAAILGAIGGAVYAGLRPD